MGKYLDESELTFYNGRVDGRHQWRKRYPEKARAQAAVAFAVWSGKIPSARTLTCIDCGGPAFGYDHYKGYAPENRLEVQPVCRKCDGRRRQLATCRRGHPLTEENTRRYPTHGGLRTCLRCERERRKKNYARSGQ